MVEGGFKPRLSGPEPVTFPESALEVLCPGRPSVPGKPGQLVILLVTLITILDSHLFTTS